MVDSGVSIICMTYALAERGCEGVGLGLLEGLAGEQEGEEEEGGVSRSSNRLISLIFQLLSDSFA